MLELLIIALFLMAIFILWCLCDISSECSKIEEERNGDDRQ